MSPGRVLRIRKGRGINDGVFSGIFFALGYFRVVQGLLDINTLGYFRVFQRILDIFRDIYKWGNTPYFGLPAT